MIGIDLGSRYIKIVKMQEGHLAESFRYDTLPFYQEYARMEAGKMILNFDKLGLANELVCATGYGKMTTPLAGVRQIPEIQAHALGAVFQSQCKNFTLLDIGGQDTKIVKIENGITIDFMMNDRCASGSGRFLENMAAILGIEFAELAKHYENAVELSSTCAIFGETEIIGRIIEGYSREQLAAGVNYSLFNRVAPMLRKLKSETIVMSGGGALNHAIKQIITKELKADVITIAQPQLNGAIGCCRFLESIGNKNK